MDSRLGGWCPPFKVAKQKRSKKCCEYCCKNKGKIYGQVPHCNFYFVASLLLLVKRFSIRFQFSNCNSLATCPTDPVTSGYTPGEHATYSPHSSVQNPESAPNISPHSAANISSNTGSSDFLNVFFFFYNSQAFILTSKDSTLILFIPRRASKKFFTVT